MLHLDLIKCHLHPVHQTSKHHFNNRTFLLVDTVLKLAKSIHRAGHVNTVNLTTFPILATTAKVKSSALSWILRVGIKIAELINLAILENKLDDGGQADLHTSEAIIKYAIPVVRTDNRYIIREGVVALGKVLAGFGGCHGIGHRRTILKRVTVGT
jgi:hypothetical protein